MHIPNRSGFSLVELLVVITIIGIMIALLLPAVQAAREAARRAQCSNNLAQLSHAALSHEEAHKHFPTGGWMPSFIGDPDRGFDEKQPGGWPFNILPYLEQGPLRSIGAGQNTADKHKSVVTVLETPLSVFCCPSRRNCEPIPNNGTKLMSPVQKGQIQNADKPNVLAISDYAGNSDRGKIFLLDDNANTPEEVEAHMATWPDHSSSYNGIFYMRSRVTMADIRDGASNTVLFGEKYMNADKYVYVEDTGHSETMYNMSFSALRSFLDPHEPDFRPFAQDKSIVEPDSALNGQLVFGYPNFGSAHGNGANFAFCDGSVRPISYSADPKLLYQLGNRRDGQPTDGGGI